MLLLRLKEYADERLKLPPTLYDERPVRYIIELDGEGRLLSRRPIDTADPAGRRTKRGTPRRAPQIQRSSGIKPLLLADKADYTLGLATPESRPERVRECQRAYLELLDRCAAATSEPAVCAVRTFLHNDPLSQIELPPDFAPGDAITFRVDGAFVTDLPSVQAFWASEHDPGAGAAARMQCLVCGQTRPVLERLQAKIKGVPGGQTSGTAIISANAEAFESYGLTASLIAPTCASCGERFTKAANALLAAEANRIAIGGAAFLFWTREDIGFSIRDMFDQPEPQQVRELIASVRSGRGMPDLDDTAFYATALSGSGGRAVVRDWIDTTVGEVREHLRRWFEGQWIVGPWGEEPWPLPLVGYFHRQHKRWVDGLVESLVPEIRGRRDPRRASPSIAPTLLRAALTGSPLPPDLLYQAVRRNRAEETITWPRAALTKLVLLSLQPSTKEEAMVQLDPDHPAPAYHCGRLLAVLEATQRLAIPGAKATIVDRFFGTASSAPASVFGHLLRGAQPHLAKLERDKPGAYGALQRRMEDVLAGIPASGFPRTLTLEEQGLFALGYYHQRAHDRAAARAASERRKAGLAIEAAEVEADLEPGDTEQHNTEEEN